MLSDVSFVVSYVVLCCPMALSRAVLYAHWRSVLVGLSLLWFGTIGKCTAVRGVSNGLGALLCHGLRGGLLGSTPSKNEVSGYLCLLALSLLRLLLDLRDAFLAMQCVVNCFDCRIASRGWAI